MAIWTASTLVTIAVSFLQLLTLIILFPFDKKGKIIHAQSCWWASTLIRLNPFWRMSVRGLDNIDPRKTYVIVANHQSLADIIVIYNIRTQFKWVAKESTFGIPFIGTMLYIGKHIKLLRGDLGSIKQVYKEAKHWLNQDISVVFFPEGTRSETGSINEFQNGAFKLAIREKKPILPVAIKGTRNLIPKRSWVFNAKVAVSIEVFSPIETKDLHTADFTQLRDAARTKLLNAINERSIYEK
ncbi:MAG: 1-acyl-sn-glycerol-3-phosphate acyltransferase [Candidatus Omnitrophica bacterium]|nr:1-acyl-sn-glycerol-3-phosphate acyltransferase [Candidatus Omnitrophota bacterium]